MIHTIGLFCSSENEIDTIYFDEAVSLGRFIGENKLRLIYGGANVGLMEETARNVKLYGGYMTGVITEKISGWGKKSKLPDRMIQVKTLAERKQIMTELANIFIALPGGFGTLDEIFDVIASAHLGYHSKKILFCNTNGFYDKLIEQIEYSYHSGFAKNSYRDHYHVASNITECIKIIKKTNKEI